MGPCEQANPSAAAPVAVIAGPTKLPASCSNVSAGFGVIFDGSQSQRSSPKPLVHYLWTTTSTNPDLLADIALANGRSSPQKQAYLVLQANTVSGLPVWPLHLQSVPKPVIKPCIPAPVSEPCIPAPVIKPCIHTHPQLGWWRTVPTLDWFHTVLHPQIANQAQNQAQKQAQNTNQVLNHA
jgi:hypothetical protein